MKRGLIAAGAVAMLLLTGCTSETQENVAVETPTPAVDAPTRSADPATASPLPTGPVEVTATTAPDTKTQDVLVGIQLTVAGYDVVVNADQIKAAAEYTCDQVAAGADRSTIVALTGDIPPRANEALVQLAADEYCPIR